MFKANHVLSLNFKEESKSVKVLTKQENHHNNLLTWNHL